MKKYFISIICLYSMTTIAASYTPAGAIFDNKTICNIAYHPHENKIVSGLSNGALSLWHLLMGHTELKAHKKAVSAVTFSPCGKYFATGSDDTYVHFWDTDEKKKLCKSLCFNSPIKSIAYNNDGTCISAVTANIIGTYNSDQLVHKQTISTDSNIISCSYLTENTYLICTQTGEILKYDLRSQEPAEIIKTNLPITSAATRGAENQCAVGSANGIVRIYSLLAEKVLSEMQYPHAITALAFANQDLIVGTPELLFQYDTENKKTATIEQNGRDALALNHDKHKLATILKDNSTIRLFSKPYPR